VNFGASGNATDLVCNRTEKLYHWFKKTWSKDFCHARLNKDGAGYNFQWRWQTDHQLGSNFDQAFGFALQGMVRIVVAGNYVRVNAILLGALNIDGCSTALSGDGKQLIGFEPH